MEILIKMLRFILAGDKISSNLAYLIDFSFGNHKYHCYFYAFLFPVVPDSVKLLGFVFYTFFTNF